MDPEIVSQATIRREVVILLINEMIKRGHREYKNYQIKDVRSHAEAHLVPDAKDGMTPTVPKEVLVTLTKKLNLNKRRGGKPAAPPDPLTTADKDSHTNTLVTAVATECSDDFGVDMNVRTGTAYMVMADKLKDDSKRSEEHDHEEMDKRKTLAILSGEMRSQLEACFFMAAFPFLFPYSIGSPDLKYQERDRNVEGKKADAPVVDFVDDWSKLIVQRAEAQFRRDLQLPFAVWNLVFRTVVNIGSNMYAVSKMATSEDGKQTHIDGKVFRDAALTILQALGDTYTIGDMRLSVDGDLQKVRNTCRVQHNPMAQRMLSSMQATLKRIEGTQEIRTLMRHEITAYRVFYGTPIMVTFAPNEKHSTLMIRMSRMRRNDPMVTSCDEVRQWQRHWGDLFEPKLVEKDHAALNKDEEVCIGIPIKTLIDVLPECSVRRRIVARDPLACVYGFRMLCRVALATLFGVKVCPSCPDCNCHAMSGCVDEFGSVALSEGGVYGRADAYYGSIECQKCGALHLHLLLFLQCMHQHLSLIEIAEKLKDRIQGANILNDFMTYKSHVDRETYDDAEAATQQRDKVENAWPLYEDSAHALVQPAASEHMALHLLQHTDETLQECMQDGEIWKRGYYKCVQMSQQMWNHHIHLPNEEDPEGPRKPMASCINKSHPKECKSRFPRDKETEVLNQPTVVCTGISKMLGLRISGKKGMMGSVVGPRNDPWLNGTHPALMYDLQCNSDTLLTYRLPVIPETHSVYCNSRDECLCEEHLQKGVIAALRAQRDQAGYVTDYASKRQPLARNEMKTFLQGQHQLCKDLNMSNASTLRHAKRSTKRMMNDLYGRGTIRMAVEAVNLLTMRRKHDATAAESMKSNALTPFACAQYLACQEAAIGTDTPYDTYQSLQIDTRNPRYRKVVTDKNVGYKYGHRGCHPAVHHLSPYQFTSEWEIQRATYPCNPALRFSSVHENTTKLLRESPYHTYLTESGRSKLRANNSADLVPGEDYRIHGNEGITCGQTWVAFPETVPALRHEYVIVRRLRPVVPKFQGTVLLKTGTRNDHARHMSVYLRPWVLDGAHASQFVPHLHDLCAEFTTWHQSWVDWCHRGVLSDRAKQIITNFQAVFALRQEDDLPSGDKKMDTAIVLTNEESASAMQTAMRKQTTSNANVEDESAVASFKLVEDVWGSMKSNACDSKKQPKQTFTMPQSSAVKNILKAARESQQRTANSNNTDLHDFSCNRHRQGKAIVIHADETKRIIERWQHRNKSDELTKHNPGQCTFIDKIATRMLQENGDMYLGTCSEPLRLLVNGGPGVGKSFAISVMRSLFDDLGWRQTQQYQFASFQAVVANQIGGDTLHHSCGVGYGQTSTAMQKRMEQSRKMSSMRWMIIDEISQVGAELLSQCETNVRSAIQAAGTYKLTLEGETRPWGGLNVIYVGDFLQLPPTRATPLTTLPSTLLHIGGIMNPRVQHGLDLFWNQTNDLVIFKKQMRCLDEWWLEVLEECRLGAMTADTCAFLHGTTTSVPGTWLNGTVNNVTRAGPQCKAQCCEMRNECMECKVERKRRCRVYRSELHGNDKDSRIHSKRFRHAITVVPNNDLKMDICKRGAALWARDHGMPILWSPGTDYIVSSCGLLDEDPQQLRQKKISWLSKHDKQCAGLFGMLPLVRGLPVFLTDHIDRSDKALLRGRSGTLVGWQLHDNEPNPPKDQDHVLTRAPTCVYVKFHEKIGNKDVPPGWSIANLENGVYAISPNSKYWYLDAKKKHSHMRIRRNQLPIAPDFARTAYSMQGFTLLAGKIDLKLSKFMDAVTAYVAMSRFKRADDVLILQPFDLEVFQQGVPDQPALLLKYISSIDKKEFDVEFNDFMMRAEQRKAAEKQAALDRTSKNLSAGQKRHIELMEDNERRRKYKKATKLCTYCNVTKDRNGFPHKQWLRNDEHRWCNTCKPTSTKLTKLCTYCNVEKDKDGFPTRQWHSKDKHRWCHTCKPTWHGTKQC